MSLPRPIAEIARELSLSDVDFEPLGRGKAKLEWPATAPTGRRGRYVAVTAVNPTPAGEGKTVTSIGLAMGLRRLGASSLVALRQPSLGPLFGMKGGGAGDGRAFLAPRDDINLHFTGDLHAVTAAANLLAALVDNHVRRRLEPRIEPSAVTWRRALDVCDRSLRRITTHDDSPAGPVERSTGFLLTPASEVMAVLALAVDPSDLRRRLGRILVGRDVSGRPVAADDVRAAGAMAALLKDALRPNLVQTCEGSPAFVHAGPFANIAHGNSSVIADRAGLGRVDYLVTESGFGSDCGAEKFFHIKCRASGLAPDVVVLVATVRALKLQSGRWNVRPGRPFPPELLAPDLAALQAGSVNLAAHLEILRQFGPPVVVAVNRFPTDDDRELQAVERMALEQGAARVAVSDAFALGGAGAEELARAVVAVADSAPPPAFRPLYELSEPTVAKVRTIARQVYGADDVDWAPAALEQLRQIEAAGGVDLPVCIAKTPYSLSHDPARLGRPRGFRLPIREVRWSAGAGFLELLAGDINLLPGLPSHPAAWQIDLTPDGRIVGLK